MERRRGAIRRNGTAAALLLVATLGAAPAAAQATGGAAAVSLDPAQALRENLARLATAKSRVEITLSGGKTFRGRVGGVGDHAVLLTELEGREFYDAWISLDEVAAVEVRAR